MSDADTSIYKKISGAGRGKKTGGAKNTITLVDMVKPEHRINSKELIKHLDNLLSVNNSVGNPVDEIQRIFDKITDWKKKAGDSEEQEAKVAKSLKPSENLKLHNITTILAKFD